MTQTHTHAHTRMQHTSTVSPQFVRLKMYRHRNTQPNVSPTLRIKVQEARASIQSFRLKSACEVSFARKFARMHAGMTRARRNNFRARLMVLCDLIRRNSNQTRPRFLTARVLCLRLFRRCICLFYVSSSMARRDCGRLPIGHKHWSRAHSATYKLSKSGI